MRVSAKEKELLDLERRFWDAMVDKDGDRAGAMTDEKCIIVGAQGVSAIDGPTMATLTKEGDWELKRYSFDDETAHVRFIGDDVAIVAYGVDEQVVVDGETLRFDVNDSSVWVRRDGEWRCALHTESLVGDPFGRDILRA